MLAKFGFALWSFALLSSSAFADFTNKDLKGVHLWLKPEYQAYSPIFGHVLLNSESLKNYRFFGNYGPQVATHGCMEKVRQYRDGFEAPNGDRIPGLVERKDCPHDFMSEWIQRLFPSVDGQIFSENGAKLDLVSHLDPQTIGKLISRIAPEEDPAFADQKKMSQLEQDLADILFEELDPEKFQSYFRDRESKRQAADLKAKVRKKIEYEVALKTSGCSESKKLEIEDKLPSLIREIQAIDIRLQEFKKTAQMSRGRPKKGEEEATSTKKVGIKWIPKDFLEVAKLIVGALKESRGDQAQYPKYLPEQALVAFFMKKYNTKENIISLYRGMPELLSGSAILRDHDTQFKFIHDQWAESDRAGFAPNAEEAVAQAFLEGPEALIFETKRRSESSTRIPPLISFKTNVPHSSLGDGVHGDCGETLVRNLINFVLYNPQTGTFDISRLDDLKKEHPELKFSEAMVQFYKENQDPSQAGQNPIHAKWNEEVLSGLAGVKYYKGGDPAVCDMAAGIDNFSKVMSQLFMNGAKGEENPLLKSDSTRSEKLDELFRLLSQKESHLIWSMKGKDPSKSRDREQSQEQINTKNLGIEFDIRMGSSANSAMRNQPVMRFGFTAGHFAVTDLSKSRDPWKGEVLKALSSSEGIPLHPASSYLLPFFTDFQTIHLVPPELQTPAFFHSLSLKSSQDQIDVFKEIASHREAKKMKSLGIQIKRKLGTTDIGTVQQIALAESMNDYPFGDPPSDAKYGRVSQEELINHFGNETAQELGSSWRDPRGLIWGDAAKDPESGQLKKVNWEEAKAYCLGLNPLEKRGAIEGFLNQVETHPGLKILRAGYMANEVSRENLLKKYLELIQDQPSGCYLPPIEEFLMLRVDLGHGEEDAGRYTPEFLPHLHIKDSESSSSSFWSSSEHIPGKASLFGNYGRFTFTRNQGNFLVRCVCH
jgi:hypothetical protein